MDCERYYNWILCQEKDGTEVGSTSLAMDHMGWLLPWFHVYTYTYACSVEVIRQEREWD